MRTPVYVELHQTGEKLAWGQTGPLGGSRLPQLSLFLSPSVAIYFSWQKKQLWDQSCQTFFIFFVPQQMRYMGIKKETEKQITICKLSFPRVFFTVTTTFSLHCVRWPVLLRLKLYHF